MLRLRNSPIPVALLIHVVVLLCFIVLQTGAQTLETGRAQDAAAQHYRRGMQWLQQEKWKEATQEFEHSLKLDASRAATRIGLGIALTRSGDSKASFAAFRRATEVEPSSPEAHYYYGLALREAGKQAEASSELSRALELKPDYEEARLTLGPHAAPGRRSRESDRPLPGSCEEKPSLGRGSQLVGPGVLAAEELSRRHRRVSASRVPKE
jgi:Flp pilus assembly protein TadD